MSLFDWLRGKQQPQYSGFDAPSIAPPPSLLPAPVVHSAPPPPAFGIENAIDLMRSLPFDENPDLVLRVVRKTLKSAGVSVEQIIESAKSREQAVMAEGAAQQGAIEQLEQQIVARRAEIDRLAAVLNETKSARERLQHAMEHETKVAPLPPDVVLQIRAEVKAEKEEEARRAESTAPPPVVTSPRPPPTSQVPPPPKSLPPPLPKSAAPPLPSKPPSSKSVPPKAGSPRSVRPPAVAATRADANVPSLIADENDEQTDNLQDAPNGKK